MGSRNALGIDIGTTTICGIAIDVGTGKVLESRTLPNDTVIKSKNEYEKIQSPAAIYDKVLSLYNELKEKYAPITIGVTGQMHGILYVNHQGEAVSPLYTWQDERGNLPTGKDKQTYAAELSAKTGYPMATGFGLTTHYYNGCNGLIPEDAKYLCTIGDYIAMKLAFLTEPVMTPSNAASLGCYLINQDAFDVLALEKAGMDITFLPKLRTDYAIIGRTKEDIPVSAAIGDNQASFIGSVKDISKTILVNVGTGSQISIGINKNQTRIVPAQDAEIRPLVGDWNIYVGSSLCGGSAYALLERFFREVVKMATGEEPASLYENMAEELKNTIKEPLSIDTKFRGTRSNPALRGSIDNIGVDNFTPGNMISALLAGITNELYHVYHYAQGINRDEMIHLVGSGNGLRKNSYLQQFMEGKFQLKLSIPAHNEEAAYGAALFSLTGYGYFQSIEEAQKIISYL